MKTRDRLWLGGLLAAAAFIWLRDRRWVGSAEDVLPVLAALPLFWWLGQPWKLLPEEQGPRTGGLVVAGLLLFAGLALQITAVLAAAWSAALWAWLDPRIEPADRPRLRHLLVLPFVAFPWITLDLDALGWWFRMSGAWSADVVFSAAGFKVTREGTYMLVQGLPMSVEAACSGLKVLQSMLIAGTFLAYSLLGGTRRYWWNIAALLPLTWFANTLRILSITGAALTWGTEFAMGWFHSWGGLFVLVVMFVLSYGLFRWQAPPPDRVAPAA